MDDNDSVCSDNASVMGSPASFRHLPANRTPLQTDDFMNSSSEAVINALKALQQKIKKLEIEREQAEQNFDSLEKEKDKYRNLLTTSTPNAPDKENVLPASTSIPVTKTLYYPSSYKPYTTYISSQPPPDVKELAPQEESKPVRDSRIGVLEKQLEYMRRMVHQAELERSKATEKISNIEKEKEEKEKTVTLEEMRSQSRKIDDLERECSKLVTAHVLAEGKIKDLEEKLEEEKVCHIKQSGELDRIAAENRQLMLNLTPPPLSSPDIDEKVPCKKKRKRGVSGHSAVSSSSVASSLVKPDWKSMPFVCGTSSSPSHSLSANVQQMLSVLKRENPTLCARITTQKKTKRGINTRDIKQVIAGLEDDLGALTFEYQTLKKERGGKEKLEKLENITSAMKKKSEHISKLKGHLKKLKKEQTVVKARPARPSSTSKEYEISVRGSNTRELLSKVKAIKEVLSSRDLQWV